MVRSFYCISFVAHGVVRFFFQDPFDGRRGRYPGRVSFPGHPSRISPPSDDSNCGDPSFGHPLFRSSFFESSRGSVGRSLSPLVLRPFGFRIRWKFTASLACSWLGLCDTPCGGDDSWLDDSAHGITFCGDRTSWKLDPRSAGFQSLGLLPGQASRESSSFFWPPPMPRDGARGTHCAGSVDSCRDAGGNPPAKSPISTALSAAS